MSLSGRALKKRAHLLMATEWILVVAGVLAAAAIRFGGLDERELIEKGLLLKTAVFGTITVVCLYYWEVYDPFRTQTATELTANALQAVGTAAVVLTVVTYALPDLTIGRGILLIGIPLIVGALLAERTLLAVATRTRDLQERILILGSGSVARRVAREVLARPHLGFAVQGFIDDDPALQGVSIVNPRVIGTTAELPALVQSKGIGHVVVALSEQRGRLPIESLLHLKLAGTRVTEAASVFEAVTGRILLEDLRPSWLVFSDGFRPSRVSRLVKRVTDIALASLGLVLAAPIMAVVAALIRLDSPGPALFRQERVGEGDRPFVLYKFRSMRQDAEAATGPKWAERNDPRVTRLGRWLRTLRLDELPQLWNVLRGDMSFVGPRPERPHFVAELTARIPYYSQRHAVKPGITGWAQVRYPYGSSVEDAVEKLQYDLYYIKNLSFALDVTVILQTIKVVLIGRGAV